MIEFLMHNWQNIVIILGFILVLLGLLRIGKEDTVKKVILSLVVQAEKAFGSGTGEFKYAYVIEHLYEKLPTVITMLYTKKEIDTMIEKAVLALKDALSQGVTLTGYEEEKYLNALSSASATPTEATKTVINKS